MDTSQNLADELLATLATLEWIDLTAIAVLVTFFVLGVFRGLIWQLSRIATLVLAYLAAGVFGDDVASGVTSGWFPDDAHPGIPLYVAYFLIFIGVVIVVGIVASLLNRLAAEHGFSFANRIGGGLLGVATGSLIVLAFLTAVHMIHRGYGVGDSVVAAAERSRSLTVSHDVLRAAGSVLPERWSGVSTEWRRLLADPSVPPGPDRAEPLELPAPTDRGTTDNRAWR